MDETLFRVVLGIVVVIATIVTGFVIPYIKGAVDAETLDKIVKWVTYAVKCAEMLYVESGMGKEKKQFVIDFLNRMLNSKKVIITEEQLNVLIEAAVNEMNREKEN